VHPPEAEPGQRHRAVRVEGRGEGERDEGGEGRPVSCPPEGVEEGAADGLVGLLAEGVEQGPGGLGLRALADGERSVGADGGVGVVEEGGESGHRRAGLERPEAEGGAGAEGGVRVGEGGHEGGRVPPGLPLHEVLEVGPVQEAVAAGRDGDGLDRGEGRGRRRAPCRQEGREQGGRG
jgi:hypothetical protein